MIISFSHSHCGQADGRKVYLDLRLPPKSDVARRSKRHQQRDAGAFFPAQRRFGECLRTLCFRCSLCTQPRTSTTIPFYLSRTSRRLD